MGHVESMMRVALATVLVGAVAVARAEVSVVRVDLLGQHAHDAIPRMGYADLGQGALGMVHGEGAWPSARTVYFQQLAVGNAMTTEVVTSHVGTLHDALVVVDSARQPHVLVDYTVYESGYRRRVLEYVRDGPGWTPRVAFDSPDNNAVLVVAALGPGDTVHAVMCTRFYARLYHATNASGAWQWEALPQESDVRNVGAVALAVDPAGAAHVVYDVENLASNPPQRLELRYATNGGGGWQREVVNAQGNTAWSLQVGPAIALGVDGAPVVASTAGETASSGSLLYSQLRLNRRVGAGSWTSEVVASQADGFVAGDGPQFTGWSPRLLLESDGRARILFSDMACWHESTGQHCQRGQIRLAASDGGGWSLVTLYPQAVNPQSYLDRMRLEAVVDAAGADRVYVLALEGEDANAGWTGSFSRLRVHVSATVLFEDGFETGDVGAWSAR